MMYSLPAGSFDAKKHGSHLECARAELWEEVGEATYFTVTISQPLLCSAWYAAVKPAGSLVTASGTGLE